MSSWKRKKNYNGKNKNYSVINKLRKEKKSNEDFEIMLANLTLEEIIALKLEISTRAVSNRMYGFPIWNSISNIVKDATLKYALSATRTQVEAMRFLGLTESSFHELKKRFKVEDYFLSKKAE
jgi:phosphoribosylaminoimidazole carboxylase (NCAIR synthetase)